MADFGEQLLDFEELDQVEREINELQRQGNAAPGLRAADRRLLLRNLLPRVERLVRAALRTELQKTPNVDTNRLAVIVLVMLLWRDGAYSNGLGYRVATVCRQAMDWYLQNSSGAEPNRSDEGKVNLDYLLELQDGIGKLNAIERAIFAARFWDRLSIDQIKDQFGLPFSYVAQVLFRTVEEFRRLMM